MKPTGEGETAIGTPRDAPHAIRVAFEHTQAATFGISKLSQRFRRLRIVQSNGDQPPLFVERIAKAKGLTFQHRPVGTKRESHLREDALQVRRQPLCPSSYGSGTDRG